MKVTVRYFASIREALGTGSEVLETGAQTLGQLRAELMGRSPAHTQALAPDRAVRMALNQSLCDATAPVADGAEVAFFPPVTGG